MITFNKTYCQLNKQKYKCQFLPECKLYKCYYHNNLCWGKFKLDCDIFLCSFIYCFIKNHQFFLIIPILINLFVFRFEL